MELDYGGGVSACWRSERGGGVVYELRRGDVVWVVHLSRAGNDWSGRVVLGQRRGGVARAGEGQTRGARAAAGLGGRVGAARGRRWNRQSCSGGERWRPATAEVSRGRRRRGGGAPGADVQFQKFQGPRCQKRFSHCFCDIPKIC
jgi:hypothetical protein